MNQSYDNWTCSLTLRSINPFEFILLIYVSKEVGAILLLKLMRPYDTI